MIPIEESRKFLDPRTVSMLSNYHLLAQLIVEGFFNGLHHGPRHGFSVEYSQHRDYTPGDPLKLVDWKLYGKTDRLFVKQYEEETSLQTWLLLDISRSMSYRGDQSQISKLQYASYLAAALAYLLLGQNDGAGLMFFDNHIRKLIPPSSANRQLNIILHELKNIQEGEASNFSEAARFAASRMKKQGLVILFSDLLDRPEQIEKTLKCFLSRGNELIVFHLLTQEELQFPFRKFGFFEDAETEARILLEPTLFKEEYLRQMDSYLTTLKQICFRHRISYRLLETTTPFDEALRTFLASRMKKRG